MLTGTFPHARMGRKKENFERNRLELIADPQLIKRADNQAQRLGLSLSAYVRQAVTRQVEADEASAPRVVPMESTRRKKPD